MTAYEIEQTGWQLPPGSEIVLKATTPGCGEACLRHQDGRAVISLITRESPLSDRRDATWVVRAGLADRSSVSFESKNYPGSFLRHRHGAVYQEPNDGGEQFASDATFTATAGRNGQGISLASCNFPARFLRHYGGEVFIASDGGPEPWDNPQWWADDVSWLPKPAWTL
jgi:hypothetical protein